MARLGDVASYLNGFAFKPSDWSNTGLPIIRIQDLTGNSYQANRYNGTYDKKYEVLPGDVLISWSASLGIYVWSGEKALLNQHIFKVIFDKCDVNKSFFIHQVDNILKNAASKTHGATMKHLTKPVFDALPFYLPSIEKQDEIAAVLDKVSDVIRLRKQQLAKLDELIKARFVEMFGDCSERRRLEEYTELITKGASPKWQGIDYCDKGTLFITSENVREGYVDMTKRKYLPNEVNDILPRSILHRNDVLINIVGASIGRAAIFENDELANINQAVAVVRLKKEALNLRFLITFLNSEEALEAYRSMKKGGARDNLSLKNVSDLMIPIATVEEQEQFAAFVTQTDKSKSAVQKSLDETQLLFDSLMQKYFG